MSLSDKKEWDWEIPLLEVLRGYDIGDVKELPVRVTADLIAHAADEIERLRAELKDVNECVAELFIQIEQLQKALEISINAKIAKAALEKK